jgi:DNA-binding NarL/FixJ family response regulator
VIGNTAEFVVVGEAADVPAAYAVVDAAEPDVVLLDITLGEADALPLLRGLVSRHPDLRTVILTMHEDGETVRQSLLAGAQGYVVKGAQATDLFNAIRAVARGERYVHSSVAAAIVDDSIHWQRSGGGLTPREREILGMLAGGQSPTQIGRAIGISVHTVRRHISNVASKLDLHGAPALRRYAETHGLRRQ